MGWSDVRSPRPSITPRVVQSPPVSDEDFEPFVGGPPPDPSERTWRHPSEVAAEGHAEAAAGHPAGLSRALGLLLAGSLGAAACLTMVAIVQARVSSGPLDVTAAPVPGSEAFDLTEAALTSNQPTTVPNTIASADAPTTSPTIATAVTTARPSPAVLRSASDHVVPIYIGGEFTTSGVMLDGYLLTSARAIGNQLSVAITDSGEATVAYLIGVDPFSDLAVYRPSTEVRPTDAFELISTSSAGDSSTGFDLSTGVAPRVAGGDQVSLAAFSADQLVIATGSIIGTDRRATTPDGQPLIGLIDTTVRRPDRSAGGLLLTNEGEPVGIVVDSSSSLASAVPISYAVEIASRLAEQGWANATWIGFVGMDHDRGVEVVDVTVDGPAEEGDLRPGDIISFFDAAPVNDMGPSPPA